LFAARAISAVGAIALSTSVFAFAPAIAQQQGLISQTGEQQQPADSDTGAQQEDRGNIKEVNDCLVGGNRLIDRGSYAEARKQFMEALKLAPSCAGAYNGIGASYLRQNNFKQAETELMKGLSLDPLNVHILNNLGSATYHQEKFDQCVLYYKQALQLAKTDEAKVEPMVNLANALADQRKSDEAIDYFNQALRIRPDFAMAYNCLARMYYNSKKYELAAENARRAVKFKPEYAMAYYHLGLAEAALNNKGEAEKALEMSLKYEKDPSYAADTRRFLDHIRNSGSGPAGSPNVASTTDIKEVESLIKARQWKPAEASIRDLLETKGDDAVLYNNLGYVVAHQRGVTPHANFEKAVQYYKKAIQLKKGPFPSAHYNLGQTYRLLDDDKSAESEFRLAIDDAKTTRTSMAVAHNALAMLLKKKNKLADADNEYKSAISQAGLELPVIHYNRALLLEKMEKTREAVREYELYLKVAPHGLNVETARVRLRRLGIEPKG
jgi:tetratricopeptide (TPR) repeat protein